MGFCLVVVAIHFSPLSKDNEIIGSLQFEILNNEDLNKNIIDQIDELLNIYCNKVTLIKYNINNKKRDEVFVKILAYEYKINIKDKHESTKLINELSQENGIFNVRINFKDDYEKI